MEFPNVDIRYEERLHAKYYANDYSSIFSSMNLLEYSITNNLEFGIKIETNAKSFLGKVASDVGTTVQHLENIVVRGGQEDDPEEYFGNMIKNAKVIYRKGPVYTSSMGGFIKKYVESREIENNIHLYYKAASEKKSVEAASVAGSCIRTGTPIPFNPERPFSQEDIDPGIRKRIPQLYIAIFQEKDLKVKHRRPNQSSVRIGTRQRH